MEHLNYQNDYQFNELQSNPRTHKMTTQAQTQLTNTVIKNLTFFWVKLNPTKPVDNYNGDGTEWTLQARFPKSREAEIEALNLGKVNPVKDDATMCQLNLRKKATKADGTPAKPVEVVDAFKMSMDPTIIGNGSEGNVIVMQRPYEIKNPKTGKVTKSGVSTTLTKVQVTKLVKFEGSNKSFVDFDEETPTANTVTAEDADF
jgi:hypothetical protein